MGMRMDPKLTGYLFRALNHEMAAVQQYLTQSTLCEMWGLEQAAGRFQSESKEELEHAQRLIRHMLSLGLVPNGAQLEVVRLGRSLKEMLQSDWRLEAEAIHLYDQASRYSARIGDEASVRLFTGILQEEREHLASLELWLADFK
jgi:bacterioferritin